ncbi:hypothetical protein PCASD_12210 [Puccinia coronata f. sp. avenae]|uniref:Uncharacterized protein n=1 Tax=Puccinia coronata f. sp. avenae TaxID=200324 RepID=A0A2N5TAW1_9BASI|nr:hypothetical protein PCASD_12210 [Puccinia coronata f. sp. avenae]
MDVGGVECTEQEVSDLDHCDDERHVGHGLLMEYLLDYRSATGPLARSISNMFTEPPYASDGGYDLTIGTSEHGENVDEIVNKIGGEFKHLLLVLGGFSTLELFIATDETLQSRVTAADAALIFEYWLSTHYFSKEVGLGVIIHIFNLLLLVTSCVDEISFHPA